MCRGCRPAGIWLDYLTYGGWFETPEPDLQESCFCADCIAEFCTATNALYDKLLGADKPKLAAFVASEPVASRHGYQPCDMAPASSVGGPAGSGLVLWRVLAPGRHVRRSRVTRGETEEARSVPSSS